MYTSNRQFKLSLCPLILVVGVFFVGLIVLFHAFPPQPNNAEKEKLLNLMKELEKEIVTIEVEGLKREMQAIKVKELERKMKTIEVKQVKKEKETIGVNKLETMNNKIEVKELTNEEKTIEIKGNETEKANNIIPVLVITCNRAEAVKIQLQTLIKYRPSKDLHPIIVSHNCGDKSVEDVVNSFGNDVIHFKHDPIPRKLKYKYDVYYKISQHYKEALSYVFDALKYKSVIITEDDLNIATDFFSYFSSTLSLLEADPTLWCVSAWNDNGKRGLIDENAVSTLYRTDFLPGLGWMFTSKIWNEIGPNWPEGFWDDWMRHRDRRKGRQCIRPEISRTSMTSHGRKGASAGQFFEEHLTHILLNEKPVNFSKLDMNFLLPEIYQQTMLKNLKKSVKTDMQQLNYHIATETKSVKIIYDSMSDFVEKANKLKLMSDEKDGVPRTAYNGIVTCFIKTTRIYLVPKDTKLANYNIN